MDERSPGLPVSLLRCARLAVHLAYAALLAMFYPHFNRDRQRRILKEWSRQLLDILDIGLRIETIGGLAGGQQPTRGGNGCLIVANHVSWLDIFVLNAIYPARFIAKSEVRNWPFIGWLCKRSGTIFIERAMRQNAASVNRHIGSLLEQGVCVGLFPEGTTTDGKQVGHFHSALIQPAIDAGVTLCPIALHYQSVNGKPGNAAAFTGDMTLPGSIWRILRSPRFDALLALPPALPTAGTNRRVLARAAQEAVAQGLQKVASVRHASSQEETPAIHHASFPTQSVYALLVDHDPRQLPK
jgi:1-acyl-sn-glycerol-3-phosphate acyltransferase